MDLQYKQDDIYGIRNFLAFSNDLDVHNAIRAIEDLKSIINSFKNKQSKLKQIGETFASCYLAMFNAFPFFREDKNQKYIVLNSQDSIKAYILFRYKGLFGNPRMGYFKSQTEILLKDLKCLREPSDNEHDLLSNNDIDEFMKIELVQKWVNRIANKRPIAILNINYLFEDLDSVCYPEGNLILNTRTRKGELTIDNLCQVFAHELGHLVQFYLTKDVHRYPESFKQVIRVAFNNDPDKLKNEELVEVFADCFGIASSYKSRYKDANYFIQMFRRKDSKYIYEYFVNLLDEPELTGI